MLTFPPMVALSGTGAALSLVLRVTGVLWSVFVTVETQVPVTLNSIRVSLRSFSCLALARSSSGARQAPATLSKSNEVVRRERMAEWAMRFPSIAVCDMAWRQLRKVLFRRGRQKVAGIDAQSVLADVMEAQAFRYRTNKQFIPNAVGISAAPFVKETAATAFPYGGQKWPALIWSCCVDLFHKALDICLGHCHVGKYCARVPFSQHIARYEMRPIA